MSASSIPSFPYSSYIPGRNPNKPAPLEKKVETAFFLNKRFIQEAESKTLQSQNPTSYLQLGKVYEKDHKYEKARNLYEQALVLNPSYKEAKIALTHLSVKQKGDLGKAIQDVYPFHEEPSAKNCIQSIKEQLGEKIQQDYYSSAPLSPNTSLDSLLLIAAEELLQTAPRESFSLYEAFLAIYPNHEKGHLGKAACAFRLEENIPEAYTTIKTIYKNNNKSDKARYLLKEAEAYFARFPEKGLSAYRYYHQQNEKEIDFTLQFASFCEKHLFREEAETLYKKALEEKEKKIQTAAHIGIAALKIFEKDPSHYAEALEHLNEVVTEYPNSSRALHLTKKIEKVFDKDPAFAKNTYACYFKKIKTDGLAYYKAAKSIYSIDEPQALAYLTLSLQENGPKAAVNELLGDLYEKKDKKIALAYYTQAKEESSGLNAIRISFKSLLI